MKNKGLCQHRFFDNPLEKKFAQAWEDKNENNASPGHGLLDYLLAKNNNRPCGEVSDRDREVAATVIQWLGSPVGQNFLDDVFDVEQVNINENSIQHQKT